MSTADTVASEGQAARDAGRALDALVAEKVMEMEVRTHFSGGPAADRVRVRHVHPEFRTTHQFVMCPHYSTDIAAAWLVVEAMEGKGWNATLRRSWDGYAAEFDDNARTFSVIVDPRAGAMPLAICRAALAVVESAA